MMEILARLALAMMLFWLAGCSEQTGESMREGRLELNPEPSRSSGTPASDLFAEDGEFVRYVDALTEEDRFSGVVLVAKDGEVLFGQAYGMADRDKGIPNQLDTKFNSVAKTFTGVAIA